jgi:hypothetical protein
MKSITRHGIATVAAAVLALGAGAARADVFTVNAYTGDIGSPFNAVAANTSLFMPSTGSQEASFTYTGPISFVNTQAQNSTTSGDINSNFFAANVAGISGYTDDTAPSAQTYGSFGTLASYLAASGSEANYAYGSLYVFTDTTPVAAGATLTITHDDGATVYDNGVALPGTTAGPTTAVTETVTVPTTGTITLVYARENGTPSILTESVPEPVTMSLLGAGLLGLGIARRSRR